MNLSTVISLPAEQVSVSNCHDTDENFTDRRVRIDFGNVSLFMRAGQVPEFRAELLRAFRDVFDEAESESESDDYPSSRWDVNTYRPSS